MYHSHPYVESNLYLSPPTHPPRRKSPVFYLLALTDIATLTVFILCIARLARELHIGIFEHGGWFKLFSIGYTVILTVATTLFLSITLSFFKAVYPAPPPYVSTFTALRGGEKATIIGNFVFSVFWCAGLGIQAGELWLNLGYDANGNEQGNVGHLGVESDGRFWARICVTAFIMIGLLVLGWFSLQGVWRNKHRSDPEEDLALRITLNSQNKKLEA
ncbi:hypothetical protein BDZ91DRAFT_715538 [Kalaharituber pfeilii]|nr:hypothetical protein BDZ91DRAFT_715538 [Kalaharituber pfeilii]